MLILNIGLQRHDNKPNTTAARALAELATAGFSARAHTLQQSSTEPTVVVLVKAPLGHVNDRIYSISMALSQDCIAVYDIATGKGELIGPKAAAWGEFNPEFFLLLNGDALGAAQAA